MANPEMQERFLRGESKPTREPKQASPRKRGKRPPAVSEAQRRRKAFLHGVKAGMIQERLDAYQAVGCSFPDCRVKGDTFEEAWTLLDLHHEVKRSRGHGYRDWDDFGVDAPWHVELVCRQHHEEIEGKPWSGRRTA